MKYQPVAGQKARPYPAAVVLQSEKTGVNSFFPWPVCYCLKRKYDDIIYGRILHIFSKIWHGIGIIGFS